MKQIFTAHDILNVVHELKKMGLEGCYLQNCYDIISQRSICLRFSGYVQEEKDKEKDKEKDNTESSRKKIHLLLDSGIGVRMIQQFTAVREAPTGFCMKLRKHLKNRKLVAINQINRDRVVDFVFGNLEDDQYCNHLVVEMYASGNILLLEGKTHKILMLLHRHYYDNQTEQDTNNAVKIGQVYPWGLATAKLSDFDVSGERLKLWFDQEIPKLTKKIKMRQFLTYSPLGIYGPVLIDHIVTKYNLTNKIGFGDSSPFNEAQLELIPKELNELHQTVSNEGYLILNPDNSYESFVPILYEHLKDKSVKHFPSFLDAVYEFYKLKDEKSIVDLPQQKIKIIEEKKEEVKDKVIKTKQRIEQQIQQFDDHIDEIDKLRQYVEEHLDPINELLKTINQRCIDKIYDYDEFKTMEISVGSVQPHKSKCVLKTPAGDITLDYTLTIHKNLTNIYQNKKTTVKKQERTKQVLQEVSKNKKINIKQEDLTLKHQLVKDRKIHWFEKYHWFYTTDGDLFILGKNATHNEELVKKYLKSNDLYFHSEQAGSGSGVLKKNEGIDKSWTEKSIEEAGNYVICLTKAWEQQSPDKPWWVTPDQVSKTAETGEFITKGSFIIRGRKNMLPLPKLELGITLLFKNKDTNGLSNESNDQLEYIVPMLAPYTAINKNKFKAKLTPASSGKIGKNIKLIQEKFSKLATPLEKAGMNLITHEDWQRVMVSGCKVIV